MTLRFAGRVMEIVAAPSGTGAFAISASTAWHNVSGFPGQYINFAAIPSIAANDVVFYVGSDGTGNTESGYGTFGTGSLTRTVILSSTNNNLACNFVGTVTLFCDVPSLYFSVAPSVAAAGTTQGTATVLNNRINVVTSGTGGVILNLLMETKIINRSGATLNAYPPSGAQIETLGANVPATIPNLSSTIYQPVSSTLWYGT